MAYNSGQTLVASALETRTGALETHQTNFQPTSGTTSTSVPGTPTLAGGTVCGLAFTAPASGRVKITWQADISHASTTGVSVVEWEIRAGNVVGSGTVTIAASDNDSIQSTGTTVATPQHHSFASGLTAGSPYNIQLIHYTAGVGNGTFGRRRITIEPA